MCNFINTYYLTFYLNKSLRTETGKTFEQRRGFDFLNFFCPCKLDFNERTHFLCVKEELKELCTFQFSLTLQQEYL